MMKKVLAIVFLLALANGPAGFALGETDKRLPNNSIRRIVLVTMDTVRADHLGFMGYPRNTSPFLDQLSGRSFLFKNAFTVIPFTPASHASIFTSLYPPQHKVDARSFLTDKCTTMAEYLKDRGYATAAFVSSYAMTYKVKRGFDLFNPEAPDTIASHARRNAVGTINSAIDWLGSKSSQDSIFLWVHLFDAHRPYERGIEYREGPRDVLKGKNELVRYWTDERGIALDFYREDKKENLFRTMNKYDGEIQHLDAQIKKLYDFIGAKGLNDNSMWIVTSDHGEGLGSHFYYNHPTKIYQEQLQAPIILHIAGYEKGVIIENLIENVDLLPTVAELAGFSFRASSLSVEGASLVPLMFGKKGMHRKYVFSMSEPQSREKCMIFNKDDAEMLPIDGALLKCDDLDVKFSLQDGQFKYIASPKGDEYYNLKEDPGEKINIISSVSGNKDTMAKTLAGMVTKMGLGLPKRKDTAEQPTETNDLHEESLRALGY